MGKKIVIALGGNALGSNLKAQRIAVTGTAKAIAQLIEKGHQVVISHGNGPQVGMIQEAMNGYSRLNSAPDVPLSVCVAMSQGYIGYDLQCALRQELLNRGIDKPVSTILTQVRVDPRDPAFDDPTKPIGQFMGREEAQAMAKARGFTVKEDAGRGYRQVVASPRPVEIVEIEAIRSLIDAGQVVIAAGGGGIPVVQEGTALKDIAAVIDKDFASARLAQMVDADCLIILTAVEKVAIHYGKPDQKWLSELCLDQAKAYIEEGHFAPGSMLPKVEAAVEFASSKPGRYALITLLEKALEGIEGKTGTIIR
jgi:carbamate kinase